MTPKTPTQNLLLWGAALLAAIVLAFLGGIAAHWPENGSIDWRGVILDTIRSILTASPFVLAGLGLPMLGKENIAALVHEIGPGPAQAALEVEAVKQATGITGLAPEQVADIVAAVKAEMVRDPEGRLAAPRVPADPLVSKPATWLDTGAPAEGRG